MGSCIMKSWASDVFATSTISLLPQLGLVSEIFSLTIPNKFQTYLYAGKPIIISADGEVANIAKRNNVGLTSPAENYFKLKKNIIHLSKLNSKEIYKIKINCKKLYKNSYDINKQTRKLIKIMQTW